MMVTNAQGQEIGRIGTRSREKVLEALFAADVAVEEVESDGGTITVFAPPAEFYKAKTALREAFPDLEFDVQEITFLPKEAKALGGEEQPPEMWRIERMVMRFLAEQAGS